jgi:hypothetical protein
VELGPPPRKKEKTVALTRDEMVEMLEDIARNGGDSARIQAIKTLLRLQEDGNLDFDELEDLIQRK